MIGDVIASALPQMRAAAESLMVDTCRVEKVTGTVTNPDATTTDTYSTVYEGKCKLQSQRAYPSNPEAGGHVWTKTPLYLHLPVKGSGQVTVGHRVTVLSSTDPANVGRVLRIRSGDRKSYQTALRFLIEEVS